MHSGGARDTNGFMEDTLEVLLLYGRTHMFLILVRTMIFNP
jgi:hypothetical protein